MTPVRKRFTAEEYHRMVEAGLLGEDDRVELLEGEIWQMSPIGSRHAAALRRLRRLLSPLEARGRCLMAIQDPVRLDAFSEPQPDLALLKPREDLYREAHPGPEDVLLLVEVAESSKAHDLERKVPLYARHGIPEVWVLDLGERALHLFRHPSPQGYREASLLKPGDRVSPLAFPEVSLEVESLL
jgi:Uma2 family endonuclease